MDHSRQGFSASPIQPWRPALPPARRRKENTDPPRRRNGRRRRREILPPIQRPRVRPRRGGQRCFPCRSGSSAEAAAHICSPHPPEVAGGDEQRVPGVTDAHAQRDGFGPHDISSRCPQGVRLAFRRAVISAMEVILDED